MPSRVGSFVSGGDRLIYVGADLDDFVSLFLFQVAVPSHEGSFMGGGGRLILIPAKEGVADKMIRYQRAEAWDDGEALSYMPIPQVGSTVLKKCVQKGLSVRKG